MNSYDHSCIIRGISDSNLNVRLGNSTHKYLWPTALFLINFTTYENPFGRRHII
jgi:hypothetical protein